MDTTTTDMINASCSGYDISDHHSHVSILYDILAAANARCPCCHRDQGNKDILAIAADDFRFMWEELGTDAAIKEIKRVFHYRYGKTHEEMMLK